MTRRPRFRVQAKNYFLTYPQCSLSKEQALHQILQIEFPTNPKYVRVAQEKHEDGDMYLHCLIQFEEKLSCTNRRMFDLVSPTTSVCFCPDIQGAHSSSDVREYFSLHGDYTEHGQFQINGRSARACQTPIAEVYAQKGHFQIDCQSARGRQIPIAEVYAQSGQFQIDGRSARGCQTPIAESSAKRAVAAKVKEPKKKPLSKLGDCTELGLYQIDRRSTRACQTPILEASARRAIAVKNKGQRRQLSSQDTAAAITIQRTFRAYLIRRSKACHALRELAVAKTKLKELRELFEHVSYRSRIAPPDAEERQILSEKTVLLLLTVFAVEGADLTVRAAKRSMVNELEDMVDIVDPQPAGGSLSMRRMTLDGPTDDSRRGNMLRRK